MALNTANQNAVARLTRVQRDVTDRITRLTLDTCMDDTIDKDAIALLAQALEEAADSVRHLL